MSLSHIQAIAQITVKGGMRNRLLLAVLFMGCLILICLQIIAGFSMRQPYQAAMAYNLAAINIIGVILTLFIGVNLINNDINSRVGYPVLAQPISRPTFLYGQFSGLLFLTTTIILSLGIFGGIGLLLVQYFHPGMGDINWLTYTLAVFTQMLALMLLGALTIFFTSVATSAIFPLLLCCATYVIGLTIRATKEFLETPYGQDTFSPLVRNLVAGLSYVMPNFSFFNINQWAIYDLPVQWPLIGLYSLYCLIYTGLLLSAAPVSRASGKHVSE